MADDTYVNPFQPNNVGEGPYNGFSVGVESARRNFELAPFKKMEQERQQLGLEKQRQQQAEFMTPEAVSSRMSAFPAQQSENELKQATSEQSLATMPLKTQQMVSEAKQHLAETQGKPAGMLLEQLGNAAPYISAAPAALRPQLYKSIIQGMKSKFPGMEFPKEWEEYSPEAEDHLGALHFAQVNSVKQAQTMQQEKLKAQAHVAGAQATAAGQIGRGQAQAAGTIEAARLRGQGPNKELEGYRKIINDPKKTSEEKDAAHRSMEMAVEPLIDDKVYKAWGNEANAQMTMGSDPQAMAARQKGIAKMRKEMRVHYGVDVRVKDPKGNSGQIPARNLEQAKKKGYTVLGE